ncbi:MAG: Asp-tRNA(Asn)/Glu-tRNA(Gln) amidotransferase subunit GatA [Roseburia sp.]|nr:Asp-tRNA(Asn)/Glu-tRNA(Gln) amidotransferase subunit GatA [Roseburia sp.]
MPTTCCSKILENFKPYYDATVWSKLKSCGAVLLGKTNMDEFAMGSTSETSVYGAPKNPRDLSRVTGGSSGGAAAAVAAGISAYALGSDTGGSIRQPASFCGAVGLKPTYGRVSRYGLVAFASSLDQIGPIARTAEDCGILLNAIAGHDPRDATSATRDVPDFNADLGKGVKGVRIALPREFYGEAIDDEVKTSVLAAAKEYERLGAVLVDCSFSTLKYAVPAYYLISSAEAASNLSRYDGVKYGLRGEGRSFEEMLRDSRSRGFGAEVKRRILLGNYALSSGYYDAYYRKALALKQEIIKEYNEVFERADVILTPTAPSVAYKIGAQDNDPVKMYTADICTVTVNIAALPAISVPCGFDRDGLPIGMSLVGKRFDEPTLLRIADAYEKRD